MIIINPQQIIDNMNKCLRVMQQGNTQLKTLGLEKAKTEKDYKVRQAQQILKLRADGQPVTIIQDLVKGNEEVVELRLRRDIAESSYFVALEAMNNLRLEIEILRTKISWLKCEFKNS